ncbi:rod shape-determining protein MreC [bacterium]|nr:rod shape-determining protein MreC [bacterium]
MLVSKKTVGTIFILLCLGIILNPKFPFSKNIRGIMLQCFRPVLSISNKTIIFFKDIRSELRLNKTLKSENIRLKNNLKLLDRKITELEEFEIENQRLRLLLELKDQVKYDTIPAQVIGRDLSGWSQLIIINKGTHHGITQDMQVVAGQGIVGKIIETGLFSSKVQLLIDKRSCIGGIMQKSRIVGLVEGTGKDYLILNYLPRDETVFVNDLVLSSGLGGVYQKGLVIGTVKAIHEAKFGLYKYADITPSVPLHKIEEVLVIFKPKEDSI